MDPGSNVEPIIIIYHQLTCTWQRQHLMSPTAWIQCQSRVKLSNKSINPTLPENFQCKGYHHAYRISECSPPNRHGNRYHTYHIAIIGRGILVLSSWSSSSLLPLLLDGVVVEGGIALYVGGCGGEWSSCWSFMDTIRCCFSCCCCPSSIAMIEEWEKGLLQSRRSVAFYMPTTCFCLCIPHSPKSFRRFSWLNQAHHSLFTYLLCCGSWR